MLLRRRGWLILVVMETLGNASGRGKDQPGVASLSCSCCLYTSAPELDSARDLRKNFSDEFHTDLFSQWFMKKIKEIYLSLASCP